MHFEGLSCCLFAVAFHEVLWAPEHFGASGSYGGGSLHYGFGVCFGYHVHSGGFTLPSFFLEVVVWHGYFSFLRLPKTARNTSGCWVRSFWRACVLCRR